MKISTSELRKALTEAQPKAVGFDIETYSDRDPQTDLYAMPAPLYPWLGGKPRLLQFSFSVDIGTISTYYVDTLSADFDWADVSHIFCDPYLFKKKPYIIGHNLAFEYAYLAAQGIWTTLPTFDTMLAERILSCNLLPLAPTLAPGNGLDLASTAKRHLDVDMPKEEQTSDWGRPKLTKSQIEYALRDVEVLLPLARKQHRMLQNSLQLEVHRNDCEALALMATCNSTGIRVDVEMLRSELAVAEMEIQALKDSLQEKMGVDNPNSPAQLLEYFNSRGVMIEDAQKETLNSLSLEEFPCKLDYLRMKALGKTIGTYYKNWLTMAEISGGYLYPNLKMIGADSGRMSCPRHYSSSVPDPSKPRVASGKNKGKMRTSTVKLSVTLQGAPMNTRKLFVPRDGYVLIDADFSSVEVRLAAYIYKDETFKRVVKDGLCQHKLLAAEQIYHIPYDDVTQEQRKIAKTGNFALIYACWIPKLQSALEAATGRVVSYEEAEKVYHAWHKLHPNISKHMDSFRSEKVYELRSLAGRCMRQKAPGRAVNEFGVGCAKHQKLYSTNGTNWPVQSTGKDLFAGALRLLWRRLMPFKGTFNYLMLVHDEVLLEAQQGVVEEVAEVVKQCMTHPSLQKKYLGDVQLEADVQTGNRWSEVH